MAQNMPLLSTVMVVGPCRKRAQRVLDRLAAQTVVDRIEVIVVDTAAPELPDLSGADSLRLTYVRRPPGELMARARSEGVRQATAEIVAFIEDHCFPSRTWAEALLEAFEGPWAAVGYAFTNANPQTYLSRANFICDYGLWAHPARSGPSRLLPGNNVAYRREHLLGFGDLLDSVLAPDFNIHEALAARGLAMCVEPRALAAHENFPSVRGMAGANYNYCRLLAANRARARHWSLARRIAYGLAVPVAAPLIKLARLTRSLAGRRGLMPRVVSALPVILAIYACSAAGESLGYLFGAGAAERNFNLWELDAERSTMG